MMNFLIVKTRMIFQTINENILINLWFGEGLVTLTIHKIHSITFKLEISSLNQEIKLIDY